MYEYKFVYSPEQDIVKFQQTLNEHAKEGWRALVICHELLPTDGHVRFRVYMAAWLERKIP